MGHCTKIGTLRLRLHELLEHIFFTVSILHEKNKVKSKTSGSQVAIKDRSANTNLQILLIYIYYSLQILNFLTRPPILVSKHITLYLQKLSSLKHFL